MSKKSVAAVPVWRVRGNYDASLASLETGLRMTAEKGKGRTVQSQKDEADINVILNRFAVTGLLPQNVRVPTVSDFDGVFDFQSAQNAIALASQSFQRMPAEIRKRFANDPQEFVAFCSNADNLDEMRKMGLAVPKKEAENKTVAGAEGALVKSEAK